MLRYQDTTLKVLLDQEEGFEAGNSAPWYKRYPYKFIGAEGILSLGLFITLPVVPWGLFAEEKGLARFMTGKQTEWAAMYVGLFTRTQFVR